jgi:hypothetical protein
LSHFSLEGAVEEGVEVEGKRSVWGRQPALRKVLFTKPDLRRSKIAAGNVELGVMSAELEFLQPDHRCIAAETVSRPNQWSTVFVLAMLPTDDAALSECELR